MVLQQTHKKSLELLKTWKENEFFFTCSFIMSFFTRKCNSIHNSITLQILDLFKMYGNHKAFLHMDHQNQHVLELFIPKTVFVISLLCRTAVWNENLERAICKYQLENICLWYFQFREKPNPEKIYWNRIFNSNKYTRFTSLLYCVCAWMQWCK